MKLIIKKLLKEALINISENDVDWDLYEIMDDCKSEAFQQLAEAIEREKPNPEEGIYIKARQPWKVIPFSQLEILWEAFIKTGQVPEKLIRSLEQIEELITKNICKVTINTEMCGHTPSDPKYDIKDYFKSHIPEDELDAYIKLFEECYWDWCDDPQGQGRISDYGLKPLHKYLAELRKLGKPEQRLAKVDQILSVIHMRSDIAGWFVEGGSQALSQLSGQERN